MAQQVRSFVFHLAANARLYQVMALGLAFGAVIMGIPSGGGGGA